MKKSWAIATTLLAVGIATSILGFFINRYIAGLDAKIAEVRAQVQRVEDESKSRDIIISAIMDVQRDKTEKMVGGIESIRADIGWIRKWVENSLYPTFKPNIKPLPRKD